MRPRLVRLLPALIGLALFIAALEVLRHELQPASWHLLTTDLLATPLSRLLAASALTALNYLVLACYDVLAFRSIGKTPPVRRVLGTALMAYAISNSMALAALSGASVRYRFYSRWGVTADELARLVFSYSLTFWLGLLALGGLSLAMSPPAQLAALPGAPLAAAAGWLLVALVAAFLAVTAVRRTPLRVVGQVLPLPSPSIAVQQLLLSTVDWVLAASVLYVLLPPSALTFPTFVGVFLLAILAGLASHVPGGIGVFEGLMVLLLKPYLDAAALLPALVVYRATYYLAPFGLAIVALVADELAQRRAHVERAGALLGRVADHVTPRLLAGFTFLAGVVLLVSGATPASPGRLSLLARLVPLGIIETSHFVGSVAGAGLIVLSQGLSRRLDAAYYLSSVLIVVGMVASLLKGFDYEEALLLLAVLAVLRRARPAFDRRAAFFETRFSAGWIGAMTGALAASVWLGFFAFKHVDYATELWWQFELHGDVSRFLRASVGAAVVVLLVAVARLIGHPPHEAAVPTEAELAEAAAVVARQSSTSANLVFLRDKTLLFNQARDGFVMYGVQGRTWVALGDPVGPDDARPGLIRSFLERADDFGGVPAFYEIGAPQLHLYADQGLAFVKLGEEAVVDLARFSLEGGHGAKYRQSMRRLERDGGVFRVAPAEEVPAMMASLTDVSNDWRRHKAGAEKGFSLGFFDDAYLRRFPVAVIERGGRIQAFANLWRGADGVELSVDLMRYGREAPRGVMEALFVHLLDWGRQHGYRRFSLGMAPLSGVEDSPLAPLWNRVGAFVYEHGESMYGFQGLRGFKDKFDPVWEARYLAYPGGFRLPRILADVSALIAGGYRQLLLK